MKLAWLVYESEYDSCDIYFEEPEYASGQVIPIVYEELEQSNRPEVQE